MVIKHVSDGSGHGLPSAAGMEPVARWPERGIAPLPFDGIMKVTTAKAMVTTVIMTTVIMTNNNHNNNNDCYSESSSGSRKGDETTMITMMKSVRSACRRVRRTPPPPPPPPAADRPAAVYLGACLRVRASACVDALQIETAAAVASFALWCPKRTMVAVAAASPCPARALAPVPCRRWRSRWRWGWRGWDGAGGDQKDSRYQCLSPKVWRA